MAGNRGDVFKFKIEGARELEEVLERLPISMGKAVLRAAARKALKPVRDRAEELAPVGPLQSRRGEKKSAGKYKKSFIVSTTLNKNQQRAARKLGESRHAVNVYVGSTDKKAHLIEFGTGQRVQRSGRRTGAMPRPANGVLRRAWDENLDKVFKIFSEEISKNLLKAARRLARKAIKGTLSAKERRALIEDRRRFG